MRNMAAVVVFACLFAQPALAIDFEASDTDYYTGSPLFSMADRGVTIAFWFRAESLDATGVICSIGHASDNTHYWEVYVSTAGDLVVQEGGGGASFSATTTGTAITVGKWHSGVVTEVSATERHIWVDGGSSATSVDNITPAGLDRSGIGTYYRGADHLFPFDGDIAYLCIWKVYEFTVEDHAAWAAGKHPLSFRPLPSVFFPLRGDGPVGTRVRDIIGGTAFATVGGSPVKGDLPPIHTPVPYYSMRAGDRPALFRGMPLLIRCREEDYHAA